MAARFYRPTQVLIMAALGLLLGHKLWTGNIYFYINERFQPLIVFGAVAALLLAAGAAWRWRLGEADHDHEHDHAHEHEHAPARFPVWTVALVALPILLGLLIPARPLGASAIDNKGLNAPPPLTVSGGSAATTLEVAPEQRTILDWVRAFNYAEDPTVFTDQPADVIGFVYRRAGLAPTQFLVTRFTVTCCAADASGVAMLVDWPDAGQLTENTWVRVRGAVRAVDFDGRPLPWITAASVETVDQPEHPYMYP